VRRLAIVEAPLPPSSFAEQTGFLAATPDEMIDALPASLKDAVAGGRRQAGKLLASLKYLVYETTLLADLRATADFTDAELARVRVPTLLAYGEASSCRAAGLRLSRAIPGARLRMLHGGHYLHLDAKDALTAALEEFLA
jgi:pimeloyl-ACP methyl ester carboxylesterase